MKKTNQWIASQIKSAISMPAGSDVDELSRMNDWKAGMEEQIVAVAKKKWVPPHEKDVPTEFKGEHRLHLMRRKSTPSAQLAQDDAMELAFLGYTQSLNDVEEVMGKVSYWQYVKLYDVEYYKLVRGLADKFIKDGTAKKKLSELKFVPPPQQPGGGGGGAPPPMASSSNKMEKEAIYLWRHEKRPYRLLGTMGNQILSGHLRYFDPEGNPKRMRLKTKKNVEVKPSSPSAKALMLMEHLPSILKDQMTHALKEKVDDPADSAEAILAHANKTGRFDFLPLLLKAIGPSKTMMALRERSELPKETLDLRMTIGRMLAPYVDKLKEGLKADGLEYEEDVAPAMNNPSLGEWYDSPRVLSGEEVGTCSDINSLLMTISAGEDKALAARKAVSVLGQYPQLCEAFTDKDWDALSAVPEGKGVADFARLYSSDDADVLQFLTNNRSDPDMVNAVVNLVATQGRDVVLGAAPEICLIPEGDKLSVNITFFSRLNEGDQSVRNFLGKLLQLRREQKLVCPDDLLDRKVMRAISAHGDKALLESACSDHPDLRCFALACASESGDMETVQKILQRKGFGKAKPEMRALALSALGEDVLPTAGGAMSLLPEALASMLGRKKALQYMKAARTDWAGDKIPEANSIFSLPEGSTTLARNLADIEDKEALLVLLRLAAEERFSGKEAAELAQIAWESLEKMDARGEASGLLSRLGLSFSDGKISEAEELSSDPQPEDVMDAIEKGDEIGAAILLDRMLSIDRTKAKVTLVNLPRPSNPANFMRLLPSELRAVAPEEWGREETHLSSDGVFAVGRPTSMTVFGSSVAFACKSTHIASKAMALSAKG